MTAIYARQSVDKKDSISIETQIDFCKNEINSNEEYIVFQDKGFSGKNTERPAFKKLLVAIESNQISKLIVYKLDRISRSLTDFASIIDILEKYNVSFVSTSEKFDTSSPVGRAMLYIIMVFAQLERETIAERIKDNYYARGKTGAWLGGPAPMGYDLTKTIIENKKASTLVPNNDINTVKEIFDLYANTNASLGSIARIMRERQNVMWNNIKLSRILHNPAYVRADADVYIFYKSKKCVMINEIEEFTGTKGCNLYGKRDRGTNKYRSLENQVLSLGYQDGIIDSQTWLKCQMKLDGNQQIKNTGKGKHSWLTGITKCGYCDYCLTIKVFGNKKHLCCSGRHTTNLCIEKIKSHYLIEIEDYVSNEIVRFLEEYKINDYSNNESNDIETNNIKIELYKVEQQINNLIESIANSNDVLISYINDKISELDKRKMELYNELSKNAVKPLPLNLTDLPNWHEMDMDSKRDFSHKIINKVSVFNDSIEIDWKR